MRKLKTIGYVYSYVDVSDSSDGFARISNKIYKTPKSCKRAMMLDAKTYLKYGGKIKKTGSRIEVELGDCYSLYDIHEVKAK